MRGDFDMDEQKKQAAREKARVRSKDYYRKNKAVLTMLARLWRAKNIQHYREYQREYHRRYRALNKERLQLEQVTTDVGAA